MSFLTRKKSKKEEEQVAPLLSEKNSSDPQLRTEKAIVPRAPAPPDTGKKNASALPFSDV